MVSRFGINQNEDAIFLGSINNRGEICIFVRPLDDYDTTNYRVLFFENFPAEPQIIAQRQDVRSICAPQSDYEITGSFVIASEDGRLTFVKPQTISEIGPERILEEQGLELAPSIHSMCIVNGDVFLCGSSGLFLSKEAPNEWRILDLALMRHGEDVARQWVNVLRDRNFPPERKQELAREKDSLQFYAIGGIKKDDLYLCGISGTILHWNGLKTELLRQATNKHLTHVFTQNNKKVWLFGLRGALLCGNSNSGFQYIAKFDDTNTIRSMSCFKEILYIITLTRRRSILYSLIEDNLIEIFVKDMELIGQAHTLETDSSSMWLIGLKGILRFDGKNWERILLIDS